MIKKRLPFIQHDSVVRGVKSGIAAQSPRSPDVNEMSEFQ